jgi:hypothetical protein
MRVLSSAAMLLLLLAATLSQAQSNEAQRTAVEIGHAQPGTAVPHEHGLTVCQFKDCKW